MAIGLGRGIISRSIISVGIIAKPCLLSISNPDMPNGIFLLYVSLFSASVLHLLFETRLGRLSSPPRASA